MIGIVDYGAGNLHSVKKALEFLDFECRIMNSRREFGGVEKIILPGVGAFGSSVDKLKSEHMHEIIIEWIEEKKPFLGICLGMQLLFEESEESPGKRGLGIFKGRVARFGWGKVPQMGWNRVKARMDSRLFLGIENESFFYFLHSFYVIPKDTDMVTGRTEYGIEYASALERENVCAVQFHPEKSGGVGLRLIKNWVETC